MAKWLSVRDTIAAAAGINPMTLERQMRVQGNAGQIPVGKRGRGGGLPFGSDVLANILFGLAGPQPSHAAATASTLGCLKSNIGDTMHQWLTVVLAAFSVNQDVRLGMLDNDELLYCTQVDFHFIGQFAYASVASTTGLVMLFHSAEGIPLQVLTHTPKRTFSLPAAMLLKVSTLLLEYRVVN